jgi:hypothetical protein
MDVQEGMLGAGEMQQLCKGLSLETAAMHGKQENAQQDKYQQGPETRPQSWSS